MLTLRAIPPRLMGASRTRPPQDIAALYFETLWRHWEPLDRATAIGLAAGAALLNARAAFSRSGAWRNGWDLGEQALLTGELDPDSHLSMAARKGVHRLLNPGAYPLSENPMKNKRLFAVRCRAAGLPVPEAFEGDPAELSRWIASQSAIVAKPNYASKGKGVTGFRRSGGGSWISAGKPLTVMDVERSLRATLRSGGVVQTALETHPDLAPISAGALPTLRVMTAMDESGALVACDTVIRLSAGGLGVVDNFNAGNIVAGLDADRRITKAFRRVGGVVRAVERHPADGRPLVGWPVPDVDAAVALAVRAHETFRESFTIIGWDVGLTPSGPCLIEGNWNPGTDILALVSGQGLGKTRLGALYRHHLEDLAEHRWRIERPIQLEPKRSVRRLSAAPLLRSEPAGEDRC